MTSHAKNPSRHEVEMHRLSDAWAHLHMIHRLIKQLGEKDLPRTREHAVAVLPQYANEVWRLCAAMGGPSETMRDRAAADARYLVAQIQRLEPPMTEEERPRLVAAYSKLAGVGGLK